MTEIAQGTPENGRYSQEDYEKCQEVLEKFDHDTCGLVGRLIILDDFLQSDGIDYLGTENGYLVFSEIAEIVATARKVLEQTHKDIIKVL